jgi:MerR family transcriptional regulator, mercuric resistance operon regulatory protein
MGNEHRDVTMRSGELARMAGASTDTLRHYERMGLMALPQRTESGYRRYPPEALARVKMIRQALAVGFSLPELARFLQVRARGGVPCREVRALAALKLKEMDRQLVDLKAMRDRIRSLLKEWDARLASTPKGGRAGLLETLTSGTKPIALKKGAFR